LTGINNLTKPLVGFDWSLLAGFFRSGDFIEEFLRFLVEILQAVFAAKFDFLAVVISHDRLAHFTELFAGDDAGGERVRLEFLGGFGGVGVGSKRRQRTGTNGTEHDHRTNGFECFHSLSLNRIDDTPSPAKTLKKTFAD
jgi:hypothetical protein